MLFTHKRSRYKVKMPTIVEIDTLPLKKPDPEFLGRIHKAGYLSTDLHRFHKEEYGDMFLVKQRKGLSDYVHGGHSFDATAYSLYLVGDIFLLSDGRPSAMGPFFAQICRLSTYKGVKFLIPVSSRLMIQLDANSIDPLLNSLSFDQIARLVNV